MTVNPTILTAVSDMAAKAVNIRRIHRSTSSDSAVIIRRKPRSRSVGIHTTRGRTSQGDLKQTSVRMELQADCYAGIWGHYADAMKQLDAGDIAQALNAASAIGDDRIQQQTQGRVVPESFTHGSSEQRVRWFKRGIESGRPDDCDTFAAASL